MAEKPTHRVTPNAHKQGVGMSTPGDIAREAIPLLEKAIFDEFGLKVKMGAELEFCLSGTEHVLEHMPKRGTWTPSQQKADKNRVLLFEQSPIVSAFYREIVGENDVLKYEIVFSHQHPGTDSCYLADALVHTKLKLQGREPLYDPVFNPSPTPTPTHQVSDYFKHVSFDPVVPVAPFHSPDLRKIPIHITNGLHINISLWDGQKNILQAMPYVTIGKKAQPNNFELGLQNGIGHILQHNLFSISPNKLSYERYALRKLELDEIRFRKRDAYTATGPTYYLENRAPGADADPHTAIMLSLAGIYKGLKDMSFHKDKTDFTKPDMIDAAIPRTRFETEILFEYKNPLNEILNTMRSGLGDAFHSAVLAQVEPSRGPQ